MRPLDEPRAVTIASDGMTAAEIEAFIGTYRDGGRIHCRDARWENRNHAEQFSVIGDRHVFELAAVSEGRLR